MVTLGSNEELKFYMQFAKSLVCQLKKPKDRVLASSWITKLQNESFAPLKTRIDFIKLLLVILQRGRLFGPFAKDPIDLQTLQQYIGDVKLPDIAKRILKEDEGSLSNLNAVRPSYQIEFSPDLKQYASAQEIPNFGTHAYFAISNEPLQLWLNVPKKTSLKIARMKPKPKLAIRNFFKTLDNVKGLTKPTSSTFDSLLSSCSSTSTWIPPSWGSQFLVAEKGILRDNAKLSSKLFGSLGTTASSCSSSMWMPPSWRSQFVVPEEKSWRDNSKWSNTLSELSEDLEDSCCNVTWKPPSQFLNIDTDCSCTECILSSKTSI